VFLRFVVEWLLKIVENNRGDEMGSERLRLLHLSSHVPISFMVGSHKRHYKMAQVPVSPHP
jgi:hypothetical protein